MLFGHMNVSLSSGCQVIIPLNSCDKLEGGNLSHSNRGTLEHVMLEGKHLLDE
jgi:hypothetical protein